MQTKEHVNLQQEFVRDSRFAQLGKEAIGTGIFWLLYLGATLLAALGLGMGDPTEYTYLFGVPLWFAVCVVIQIVAMLVAVLMLNYWYQEIDLAPNDPAYSYEQEGNI